jgi:CheY-like chemotaxis protein
MPGINQLMRDIAENVSFGLQMFEREQQKEPISCMLAALSSYGRSIMRAKSRDAFDIVFSDVVMPGMKEIELANTNRER